MLLFVFPIIIGCASSKSSLNSENPESDFEYASKLYEQKKYAKSAQILDKLVMKLSGSPLADDAYLLLGKSYMGAREYEKAAVEFRWLSKYFPQSELVPQASFLIAECYRLAAPRTELDQEYTRKAIEAYNEFIQFYPNSEWADSAIKGIKICEEKLAQKLFLSAQLYYKMKQDSSALICISAIKSEYPETKFYYNALWLEGTIKAKSNKELARHLFEYALKTSDEKLKSKIRKSMKKLLDN